MRARCAGQRAERVIGVSDGAVAVAAHDHVALRLDEALGALLLFLELPIAVRGFLEALLEVAQLLLHAADSGDENPYGAARGAEQRSDADGEHIGIVVGAGRCRARQEAERERKRHRGDDGGADESGKYAARDDGGLAQNGETSPHGLYPPARNGLRLRAIGPLRLRRTYRCVWGEYCLRNLAIPLQPSGRIGDRVDALLTSRGDIDKAFIYCLFGWHGRRNTNG